MNFLIGIRTYTSMYRALFIHIHQSSCIIHTCTPIYHALFIHIHYSVSIHYNGVCYIMFQYQPQLCHSSRSRDLLFSIWPSASSSFLFFPPSRELLLSLLATVHPQTAPGVRQRIPARSAQTLNHVLQSILPRGL